jgi:hypothetical protein
MIDVETALQQEFFHVTIAQGIPEIPSHPTENDLGSKVTPFEERCSGHRWSPVILDENYLCPSTRSPRVFATEPALVPWNADRQESAAASGVAPTL